VDGLLEPRYVGAGLPLFFEPPYEVVEVVPELLRPRGSQYPLRVGLVQFAVEAQSPKVD